MPASALEASVRYPRARRASWGEPQAPRPAAASFPVARLAPDDRGGFFYN